MDIQALSLFFPVAAQIYWIIDIWQRIGILWNFLTLTCSESRSFQYRRTAPIH
jgi:hypothetical protein